MRRANTLSPAAMDRKDAVQRIFKAMFALEEARQILRETVAEELDDELRGKLEEIFDGVCEILKGVRREHLKYIVDRIELRTREEEFINIDPIQAGGRLTPEARKVLIAYGDGYSICDYCLAPHRLDYIKRPPVAEFLEELAEFLNMDVVRVVRGARDGFRIVTNALLEKGDVVLVSALAHYSLCLAIEAAGGVWREVPLTDGKITGEAVASKIEEVKKEKGRLPKLVAIEHFDYVFGNEHDVKGVAKVCREYGVPFLYNGAYSVGVMPVDGKDIGADFVVGSGHKSMAAPAPTGVLATTEEWASVIFKTAEGRGDVTGRGFGAKESYLLGCTVMGAPLVAMMASFPHVRERVKKWNEEVQKSNFFVSELLKIEGTEVLSELPRRHTLSAFNTERSFDVVARTHKRRGFFLHDELRRRKITGLTPGMTKELKLNVYGLTWEQVKYVAEAFKEIAERYGLSVSD